MKNLHTRIRSIISSYISLNDILNLRLICRRSSFPIENKRIIIKGDIGLLYGQIKNCKIYIKYMNQIPLLENCKYRSIEVLKDIPMDLFLFTLDKGLKEVHIVYDSEVYKIKDRWITNKIQRKREFFKYISGISIFNVNPMDNKYILTKDEYKKDEIIKCIYGLKAGDVLLIYNCFLPGLSDLSKESLGLPNLDVTFENHPGIKFIDFPLKERFTDGKISVIHMFNGKSIHTFKDEEIKEGNNYPINAADVMFILIIFSFIMGFMELSML